MSANFSLTYVYVKFLHFRKENVYPCKILADLLLSFTPLVMPPGPLFLDRLLCQSSLLSFWPVHAMRQMENQSLLLCLVSHRPFQRLVESLLNHVRLGYCLSCISSRIERVPSPVLTVDTVSRASSHRWQQVFDEHGHVFPPEQF